MDAVITYVNGADPQWQALYASFSGAEPSKRFRDWGMLPLQIRAIRKHLPFIEKIYLVVALPSQVPAGLPEDVEVVLHKDIIPREFMPTFNSAAIEMFLHRIPGLDNQFIYINDDCIPVMPCAVSDFFIRDKIVKGFSKHLFSFNQYKKHCRNSDRLARKACRKLPWLVYLRPQHTASPMFKDACEAVWGRVQKQIEESITPVREDCNVNQNIFQDYLFHKGRVVNLRMSNKHISMGAISPRGLAKYLANPTEKWVCINDFEMSDKRAEQFRKVITEALSV